MLSASALAVLMAFGLGSCEQYDLDERMPDGAGSSIYDYLADNGFQTYVDLIDELGYKEVLSKTGSKTLFVADEEAVKRFYQSGVFEGVTCYDDLSLAQKKMLLYGSMLNNPLQVAAMSSSEGTPPIEGDCMRRVTSLSIFDSVPVLMPSDDRMPNNAYWKHVREAFPDGAYCLRDATVRPMVFFTNKYLTMKKMTDDDYDFLFNQGRYARGNGRDTIYHQAVDATVNGVRIKTQNIKCLNGFINVMDEVIYPLPNMAEYLANNRETSIYSSLLDRYCAPYYDMAITREYNDLRAKQGLSPVDTVYEVRYFSQRSKGGNELGQTAYNQTVVGRLRFDPGWNTYFSSTVGNTSDDVAAQQNMAVMLVPSDSAMAVWWNNGGGKALKERYGLPENRDRYVTGDALIDDIAGVPDEDIVDLLYNNMLSNFNGSVPSKFESVLNDANDPMGLETDSISKVQMCNNGAIYFTKMVYSPTSYRSVSFPTKVNERLWLFEWAIKDEVCGFTPYLNSMVSKYSFFIPQDTVIPEYPEKRVVVYNDPVSGGDEYSQSIVFYYEPVGEVKEWVKGDVWNIDPATGALLSKAGQLTSDDVKNRLNDMLDYHIVIGDVEDSHSFGRPSQYEYFQTKGRGTVKFELNRTANDTVRLVYGGLQIEKDEPLRVVKCYDMTISKGNGRSYVIPSPLLSSKQTVSDVLLDEKYPEFSTFFELASDIFAKLHNEHPVGGGYQNFGVVSTFNTYHYTVYVPGNDAISKFIAEGRLMNTAQIAELDDYYADLAADAADAENPNHEALQNTFIEKMIYLSKALRTDVIDSLKALDEFKDAQIWNESDSKYTSFWNKAKSAFNGYANTSADSTFVYTDYTQGVLAANLKKFVKYHIQDNSVYSGAEFKLDTINLPDEHYAHFETAYMNEDRQFEKLSVRVTRDGTIEVWDRDGNKNRGAKMHTVDRTGNSYNIMCREYEYSTDKKKLETSSYAVVHKIDSPLDCGIEFPYLKF